MLRPQGYLQIVDPARPHVVERDSCVCGHCQRVVFVKPLTAATTYLIPQRDGTWKEEAGASCRLCMKPVCLTCHAKGRCRPWERRLEEIEARARFLRSAGING